MLRRVPEVLHHFHGMHSRTMLLDMWPHVQSSQGHTGLMILVMNCRECTAMRRVSLFCHL